jgi:hypothetical protein
MSDLSDSPAAKPVRWLPYSHPAFRPYVVALGQLALMWNELHEMLGLLYCSMMGVRQGVPVNQHLAVWHALKVDRAQRDILLAAAESVTLGAIPITFIDDIKWLCDRANAVEDARNNAVHSPLLGLDYGDKVIVQPRTSLGHVRARRLAIKADLLSEFRWCRDASYCLIEYALSMHDSLFRGFVTPWPNRPAWPTHQATNVKRQRPQHA